MTNLLEREVNHSKSESTRLNNLNNRFVDFLNLVKSETKRSDCLQATLREEKQNYVRSLQEKNLEYVRELQTVKNSLNEMCLSVSEAQLRERSNRVKSDWYSKLVKFETENLQRSQITCKSNEFSASTSFSSSGYFMMPTTSQTVISSDSASNNSTQNDFDSNLFEHSNMSSSQTSLSSAYSSSSFIASTTSEEIITSTSTSTETHENLETYLSNVKYMRSQLEFDYERKYTKYLELKENVSNLNTNLTDLHDRLDLVKVDNVTLSENVKNLRKEVEFYRNLKEAKPGSELDEPILDLKWLKSEMASIKRDTTNDYDAYTREQIDEYEEELEQDLLEQIDLNELEFLKEQDEFEAESEEILDELIELNRELSESVAEYETLTETNQRLNDRLIQLSTNLCSFTSLNKEQQDNLILNYSVRNLERQVTSLKQEVKSQRTELINVKNYLIRKDILNLLDPNQLISFDLNNQTHSAVPRTCSEQPPKYELKIRPYNSQIEYTKSNLFAYLLINFDVTKNYLTTMQQNTKTGGNINKNVNLNCMRIVYDSIDGHNLVIENSHKILDLDLSEWTLRREIQNYVDFNSQLNEQPLNNNVCANNNANREIIEFKFPKGFRLKRRRKINLVAAGKLHESSDEPTQTNLKSTASCNSLNDSSNLSMGKSSSSSSATKKKFKSRKSSLGGSSLSLAGSTTQLSTPTITQTKCACCACKMLMTKKGGSDMDIFEAKEINSWGTGLLVITKFINSKNIVKLVNYKCLKHIWVNNNSSNITKIN